MHGLITTSNGEVTLLTDDLPITLASATLQIKSHSDLDDSLVTRWITSEMQNFEEATGQQIMLARRVYYLDAFPCQPKIELPFPKLVDVELVEYKNSDGDWVSFGDGASPETVSWQAHYPGGVPAQRGWVEPKYGFYWPVARFESPAVRITFTCGYAETTAEVPALIASAIGFGVTDANRFRGGTLAGAMPVALPQGIEAIYRKFKYAAVQTIVPRAYL